MATAFPKSRAQTNNTKRIPLSWDRPDQGRAIDCIGNRTVDHTFDPHIRQNGHPRKGPFKDIHHTFQIIGTQII